MPVTLYPRGIFTLRAIIETLGVDDTPSLMFIAPNGEPQCIQLAHVEDKKLLTLPLADTQWQYLRITREWIPIFTAVNPAAVWACVEMTPDISAFASESTMWVTPLGAPLIQYLFETEAEIHIAASERGFVPGSRDYDDWVERQLANQSFA
jgi:hypothetical protein